MIELGEQSYPEIRKSVRRVCAEFPSSYWQDLDRDRRYPTEFVKTLTREEGITCGTEANMAKMLASEASWYAADQCVQTHGGFGFAEEFDVERKFRETRLYQVGPISTSLILSHVGTHVLGMPKSF